MTPDQCFAVLGWKEKPGRLEAEFSVFDAMLAANEWPEWMLEKLSGGELSDAYERTGGGKQPAMVMQKLRDEYLRNG